MALDAEPESNTRLEQRIPAELRRNLRIETLAFEDVERLPRADFTYFLV
jgi:hypothetical protein